MSGYCPGCGFKTCECEEEREREMKELESELAAPPLLEATVRRIRQRIGEVKAGYERNRTFYITHQNWLNAGVYDLRIDGLNEALEALDNALAESPASCHLQASNALHERPGATTQEDTHAK